MWFIYALFTIVVGFLIPFFYTRAKVGIIPDNEEKFAMESERRWREEKVGEILKILEESQIDESIKNEVKRYLEELKNNLPKETNNEIVGKIKNLVGDSVKEKLDEIYIWWEPDMKKVERGRDLYRELCMTCHGVRGDGVPITPLGLKIDRGVIWARDFTGKHHKDGKIYFKFSSMGFGSEFATDEDLIKTIKNGLPGTPMPGFKNLKDDDVLALVEYIKFLGEGRWKFFKSVDAGKPQVPQDFMSEERIERGKQLFGVCTACHGVEGANPITGTFLEWYVVDEKGEIKKDENGNPVFQPAYPRNLKYEPLRRGEPAEVFVRIKKGIAGTTMTPWAFPDDQIWDLVSYIFYLRSLGRAEVK